MGYASRERLPGPVESAALNPRGQFGADRVEDAGGPGTHDRREAIADALRVLCVGLLDGVRVRLGLPVGGRCQFPKSCARISDEYWGVAAPCNLELLHLIAKQNYIGASLADPDTIAGWKAKFLAVWDESIDEMAAMSNPSVTTYPCGSSASAHRIRCAPSLSQKAAS
ncbi:hypothetical protein KZ829_18925 [Actinoplanes hulinensis]|uniref:Uncharacterized protein n=1 Tax=Actinoplanes hulinensis TaxID=1144547 RepID=A0ABS7B5U9_9ACTN|nr:hypothetical protein [Actinoplanes hulinensis]MBW6435819.1 hypothetical protein [Actinoplanes hulinensis]